MHTRKINRITLNPDDEIEVEYYGQTVRIFASSDEDYEVLRVTTGPEGISSGFTRRVGAKLEEIVNMPEEFEGSLEFITFIPCTKSHLRFDDILSPKHH